MRRREEPDSWLAVASARNVRFLHFCFRFSCVLLIAVGASGCFPFATTGFRTLPGNDWPGDLNSQFTFGANLPIPLATRPRDAIYMDVGVFFT